MSKEINNQQSAFERKIAEFQEQLGIPEDYSVQYGLRPCEECTHSVSIGQDIFGRDQQMAPQAARAWFDMKAAAASCGIELEAVSAFRSVKYQAGIIRRKLKAGQNIEKILKVSAAPGYSEHHTGRALDISTPGFEPLEEPFEDSPAFEWLQQSAEKFGFKMSFPRDNPHGISYEPWHWCWVPDELDSPEV